MHIVKIDKLYLNAPIVGCFKGCGYNLRATFNSAGTVAPTIAARGYQNIVTFKNLNIIFKNSSFQNQSDQFVNDYGNNQRYAPAIYTHCYDTSGTRLFAAGGPLQIGLKGNYLSLFQ